MSTRKETVEFLLECLGMPDRFTTKSMFGEYALYADGRTIALVCDGRLFVKIVPASEDLRSICEQGPPYPGAKPHYLLEEDQWTSVRALPRILIAIATALPELRSKKVRGKGSAK